MTAGFNAFNTAGAVTIDSALPYTRKNKEQVIGAIVPSHYNFTTPWGTYNGTMGAVPGVNTGRSETLTWLKLNTGGVAFPAVGGFTANSGRIIQTSKIGTPISGYLDVYNELGQLVWSAASAATTPRLQGVIELGVNTPIDNQDYSVSMRESPYILLNNFIGEISDDGEVVGWSGVMVRWTGTHLQFRWARQNQPAFSSYGAGRGGMALPYAYFANG